MYLKDVRGLSEYKISQLSTSDRTVKTTISDQTASHERGCTDARNQSAEIRQDVTILNKVIV
jgi:hypothetical protein